MLGGVFGGGRQGRRSVLWNLVLVTAAFISLAARDCTGISSRTFFLLTLCGQQRDRLAWSFVRRPLNVAAQLLVWSRVTVSVTTPSL